MRETLLVPLSMFLLAGILSARNTLANRRDLFAPTGGEGPYTNALSGPPASDAFSKAFRARMERKMSRSHD